jgi:hypothetical protein
MYYQKLLREQKMSSLYGIPNMNLKKTLLHKVKLEQQPFSNKIYYPARPV